MKYDWGASFFFSLFILNYLGAWMDYQARKAAEAEPVPLQVTLAQPPSEPADDFDVFFPRQ